MMASCSELTSITSGSTTVKSYGYYSAGCTRSVTTSAGTTNLSYDYEDRVTQITLPCSVTDTFTYNGLDTRVGKVDSTGTYTFKRDGADVADPVLSDGFIAYTPGISERKSGASTFDHADYLGSFTRQTNASQTTTATRVFDAFGNLESSTGTPRGPFGFVGAEGYQADADSGLMLLGHRYYDSSTGRFLTRDAIKDGRNWYVYVDDNPNCLIDPNGLEWYYSVQSGLLWWEDPATGDDVPVGYGFSGKKGKWRNNPKYEPVHNKGPVPEGGYTMGKPRNHKSNGKYLRYNIPLTPDKGNNMLGRGGILVHGGDPRKDPSEGCMIFPYAIRLEMWDSGDHHITVGP